MSLLYKKGSEGQEVKRLQRALGITSDGKFGPRTEQSVKKYQGANHLADDGVVGSVTREALGINIYAGIDVSRWNGNIPWGNVDKSRVEFVWAKMSQGQDWYDKSREHNLVGCRSEGIPVGGYHFPSPHLGGSQDPKKEVEQFIRAMGPVQSGDMLPVLDLEAGVKGDPDFNRQWALEWLQEFEKETGLRCAVYTARWYVNGYLKRKIGDLKDYPLWVADYSDTRNEPDSLCGWDNWAAWQWTSKGEVDGLGRTGIRKCDRNWLPGGPEGFEKLKVCKGH
jgi:lysozyme